MTKIELLYDVELETTHPEALEETVKLLTEMGLDSQLALYTKEEKVYKSLFPFCIATNEQLFVYRSHFPHTSSIGDYKDPIPLRVLEVLKLAKDSGKFTAFEVWHNNTGSYKSDPVLVGKISKSQYEWDFYLLARWGDALEDYSSLRASACKKYAAKLQANLATVTATLVSFGKTLASENYVPKLTFQNWGPKTLAIPDSMHLSLPGVE